MSVKLEQFNDLLKGVNRSGVHRCSICNCVSSEDVETEIGDYQGYTYFVNDPKDPSHFICGACDEVVKDLRNDYEMDDYFKEEG